MKKTLEVTERDASMMPPQFDPGGRWLSNGFAKTRDRV